LRYKLAKHLQAEVTGVCGPNNINFIKNLGADKTLDYTDDHEMANWKYMIW